MLRRLTTRAAVLVALNFAAHFVPLERRGFEPDDYAHFCRTLSIPRATLASQALAQYDRPLGWWLTLEMERLVGLDPLAQLAAVVLASSLLAVAGLALFTEITGCERYSFWLAVLFVLWPAHHPMHGNLVYATIAISACLFVGAATMFLRFARRGGPGTLTASLLLYAAGLLSYELGFFVPLVAWGVAREQRRPRHAWALAFAGVALLYLAWRVALTGVTPLLGPARTPSFSALPLNTLRVLPAHFVGHIAARNFFYGLWGFIHLPAALAALDLACAALMWAGTSRMLEALPQLTRRNALTLTAGLFVLAAPACLVLVESRHTVLASLAFAPMLGQSVRSASRQRRWLGGLAMALLLISNQGLALRQAEAGRLSAAMFAAVRERHAVLESRSYAVFDLASLARRIPFTWRPKRDDVLRTYWGLSMFAPWGLENMLCAAGIQNARALGCTEPLRLTATHVECSRVFSSGEPVRSWSALTSETTIFDFEGVCGKDGLACPPLAGR